MHKTRSDDLVRHLSSFIKDLPPDVIRHVARATIKQFGHLPELSDPHVRKGVGIICEEVVAYVQARDDELDKKLEVLDATDTD